MYEIRSNILGKRKRKDAIPQDVVNDALRKRMLIISKLVESSSAFYPIKFRIVHPLPACLGKLGGSCCDQFIYELAAKIQMIQ